MRLCSFRKCLSKFCHPCCVLLLIGCLISIFIFVDVKTKLNKFINYHSSCFRAPNPKSIIFQYKKFENCLTIDENLPNWNFTNEQFRRNQLCYKTAQGFDANAYGQPFNLNIIPAKIQKILSKSYNDNVNTKITDIPFITASSANHFGEFRKLVNTWQQHCPYKKLVVYDLGLNSDQIDEIDTMNITNLVVRHFHFDQYPPIVGNLFEYRWKLLLLIEALDSDQMFIWIDASFRFLTSTCSELNDKSFDSSSPVVLFLNPKHSIMAATHPSMYKYFPANIDGLRTAPMLGTGFMLVRRNPVSERMQLWWVLCALTEECLYPKGAVIRCHWNKTNNRIVNDYSCCHRFDQSLINLLLYIQYGSIDRYYLNDLTFSIQRDFFNY